MKQGITHIFCGLPRDKLSSNHGRWIQGESPGQKVGRTAGEGRSLCIVHGDKADNSKAIQKVHNRRIAGSSGSKISSHVQTSGFGPSSVPTGAEGDLYRSTCNGVRGVVGDPFIPLSERFGKDFRRGMGSKSQLKSASQQWADEMSERADWRWGKIAVNSVDTVVRAGERGTVLVNVSIAIPEVTTATAAPTELSENQATQPDTSDNSQDNSSFVSLVGRWLGARV